MAAAIAEGVVPARAAIAVSVSPGTTRYEPEPELVVLTRSVVDPDEEPDSRIAAPSGRIPLTSRPLAAASAVAVVPIRAAIPLRVSPRTTT